ncbi:MAG: PEP-CTERM sorting domain-containing protein [Phycisphaerales bacterium]
MKTLLTGMAAAAMMLPMGASVMAGTTTIDVNPSMVPDEMQPLVNVGDAPAGFGPDSWSDAASGKVNWHARYGADGDALSALFGAQAATLTLADIASISYNVKSTTEHWFLKVYTRPDNVNDQASWYGYSFTNDYGTIATDGNWQQWSTGSGGNFDLDFRSGIGAGTNYLDWATMQSTYGSELVEMISIQTDSGAGTAGSMDGLVITLGNGDVGQVNFVPEPASLALMGLGGLAAIKRRRA